MVCTYRTVLDEMLGFMPQRVIVIGSPLRVLVLLTVVVIADNQQPVLTTVEPIQSLLFLTIGMIHRKINTRILNYSS